jgi:hypothetical protein
VTNLVDLSATLANDGTDHVVRDIDLLGKRLAGHGTTSGGGRGRGSTAGGRLWSTSSVWSRLMGGATRVGGVGSRSTVRHGWLADRGRGSLAVQIRDAVRTGLGAVRVRVVTLECFRMTILATSWLRDVRDDLHATGNGTGRTTTTSSIGRGRRATESLRQLLAECNSNIVCRNMHGIGNTENDKGALSGQGKAGIRGVEARAGSFLDLTNTASTLADDGANENVRD